MLFCLLALAAVFLSTGLPIYRSTMRQLNTNLKHEGPFLIAEHIRRRNRHVLGILLAVTVMVAFLESVFTDVAILLSDLQLAGQLGWARIGFGTSTSLSWLLYLCIAGGGVAGVVWGTLRAFRQYPLLGGVQAGRVLL